MAYSNITITITTGLSFYPGQYVQVIHDENDYIFGQVVSYDALTGSFTFLPITYEGSGSHNSWTIVAAAVPGSSGTAGTAGTSGSAGTAGTPLAAGLPPSEHQAREGRQPGARRQQQ